MYIDELNLTCQVMVCLYIIIFFSFLVCVCLFFFLKKRQSMGPTIASLQSIMMGLSLMINVCLFCFVSNRQYKIYDLQMLFSIAFYKYQVQSSGFLLLRCYPITSICSLLLLFLWILKANNKQQVSQVVYYYYFHTRRDGNKIAHSLARLAINFLNCIVVQMKNVSSQVSHMLQADVAILH